MPRGELVGEAYVRIHADTTFMRRAIKRAAEADAKDYTKSFSKRVEAIADQEVRRGREALARAIALQDFSQFERQFGSVRKAVRGVREEMASLIDKNLLYARDVGVIENALKKWEVPAQMREDMDRAHEAALKYDAQLERTHEAALRVNKAYEAQVRLGTQMAEAQDKLELEHLTSSFHNLSTAVRRDNKERERAIGLLHRHGLAIDEVAQSLVRDHSAAGRLLTKTEQLNQRFTTFGIVTGRLFGKGSRNNFLNFIGSAIGGIASLTLKMGTLIGPITLVGRSIGEMIDTFKVLRVSGNGLVGSLGGALGTGLKSAAGGLAGLAAAAAVLVTLLPMVAAGFSLLAGSLVSIAGALSLGVIGGLLAVVPAALAGAAGIGTMILAIIEMKREGSAAKKSMEALNSTWKKTLRGLRPELAGVAKAVNDSLGPLITNFLDPLVNGLALALRDVIKQFGQVMNSKQMKGFLDIWETALPAAFESFGKGLNNLLAGLFAFFTPVLSQAADLTMGFEKLTDRFLKWATSAKGQNEIADFMDTAWEAANSLWSILGNVVSIIGNLFNVGTTEGGGQSFLDYLDDITERFNTFLESPEGKTAVKDFFTDVKKFMVEAKDTLEGLAKTFDELDTKEARDALISLADGINTLIDAFSRMVGWIQTGQILLGAIANPAGFATGAMKLLAGAFDEGSVAGQKFHEAMTSLNSAWTSIQLGFAKMNLFIITGIAALNTAFWDWASNAISTAAAAFGWVPGLGPKLQAAAATVGRFKDDSNAHLARVKKDLEIKVKTLEAEQRVQRLTQLINSVTDRSVTVTANVRYVYSGLKNGSRPTVGGITVNAAGSVADRPTIGIYGEAGPEAIVPLRRPLSMVDPSVRALSAIAQGKATPSGTGRAITVMPGAIVVHSNSADAGLVAQSVVDRLAAAVR